MTVVGGDVDPVAEAAVAGFANVRPTAALRRSTFAPTDSPPERAPLATVYRQLGSDELLVYASDFPHLHEEAAEAALLGFLDFDQRERLLRRNAQEFYGAALACPPQSGGDLIPTFLEDH
jgi:hypothetical protein